MKYKYSSSISQVKMLINRFTPSICNSEFEFFLKNSLKIENYLAL